MLVVRSWGTNTRAFLCPMSKVEETKKEVGPRARKRSVIWQPQVERRWLVNLLGDEKAVAPLLKFLKTTGIGGRKGARERELEWERKNDQEGEDLLGWTQEGKTPKVAQICSGDAKQKRRKQRA